MADWHDAEEHIERAHEHYEAARWDEAEAELRRALELVPSRAEWHFNLGLTLEAAGRHRKAIGAFLEAHRLEPEHPQAALCVGVNHLRAGDPEGAIQWLGRAARLAPERSEPHVHLIEAYARSGRHQDAEVAYYMALQCKDVDHALALVNLSDALIEQGKREQAVWCLREAAELDPDLPNVHARLAEACWSAGRLDRARQLYLAELRSNPGDVETLLDLGELLVEMNRWSEAREKFSRVLELESDNTEAHFQLADIAFREGRVKEAAAGFGLVARLDPDHADARRYAARALFELGERRAAAAALREELKRLNGEPLELDPALDLGEQLLATELTHEASALLEETARRFPDEARAHHLLAVGLFEAGERARGIAASRRAVRLDGACVAAMHNLALANIYERRWRRADVWRRRAARIEPDDASLRRLNAALRLQRILAWAARAKSIFSRKRRSTR